MTLSNLRYSNETFDAGLANLTQLRTTLVEQGFCVVRAVFSPSELAKIESGLSQATSGAGDSQGLDLLSCPELQWIILDQRILRIVKALLGPKPVYYGETALNYEQEIGKFTLNPLMELHADAAGTPGELCKYWNPAQDAASAEYPAYRFAIYLRDYQNFSGGLKVVPGSNRVDHQSYEVYQDKRYWLKLSPQKSVKLPERNYAFYNVASQPGDIVIWNLHTLHSAGALRPVFDPDIALPPEAELQIRRENESIFVPSPGPRNAIFFDFGRESEELDLYIKFRALMAARSIENPPFLFRRYDQADTIKVAREHDLGLRFDSIILSLGFYLLRMLSSRQEFAVKHLLEGELAPLARRLLFLATIHKEFSQYFPLCETQDVVPTTLSDAERLEKILQGVYLFCQATGLIAPKENIDSSSAHVEGG